MGAIPAPLNPRPAAKPAPSRSVVAACGPWPAILTFYGPGEQPAHAHAYDQLSVLLAGELSERHGSGILELSSPAVAFKEAGYVHSNSWGRSGALIFSVRSSPEKPLPIANGSVWHEPHHASRIAALAAACMSC